MHILVVLRLVPDTSEELELAANGKDIDREWIGLKLNEFDDHALEEAILLKEHAGAKVTAIALDGEGVDRMLQSALARGADEIVKLAHSLPSPVPATQAARLFAAAALQLECQLVLTGVQTTEDIFGQLAPALGAILDWPQVSAVSSVAKEGDELVVHQEYSGGYAATIAVPLPAVLGVQAASQPPRYVSGSKLREVMSRKPEVVQLAEDPGDSRATIAEVVFPESGGNAEMLEGEADQVAKRLFDLLQDRGFLRG